jgi:hypothetical protein
MALPKFGVTNTHRKISCLSHIFGSSSDQTANSDSGVSLAWSVSNQ